MSKIEFIQKVLKKSRLKKKCEKATESPHSKKHKNKGMTHIMILYDSRRSLVLLDHSRLYVCSTRADLGHFYHYVLQDIYHDNTIYL